MNLKDKKIDELLSMEWLETNGLGSYASSSIVGANTRKYHGLLVASMNPPTERTVLVAKVEERIFNGDGDTIDDLSVNQYPEAIHPKGYAHLQSFERRPIATWIYKGKGWKLSKKVFMVPHSNTTVVIYENLGKNVFDMEVHPLLEHKDYHWTMHQNNFDFYYETIKGGMKIYPYPDSSPFYIGWSRGDFIEERAWYNNIQLYKEAYRGQESTEDYYRIGMVKANLKAGQKVSLTFTTEENMVGKRTSDLEKKVEKSLASLRMGRIKNDFYNDLLVSGNQFVVNRASTNSKSIIAGYHWFTDWGRDTMIAMRGLSIAIGDQVTSKSILSTFLKYVDKGMLPNRFPDYDGQEVEYNTIDATLWLFVALYEYEQRFNDTKFIQDNIKILEEILLYHIKGTLYNIHLTDKGFISGGQENWQLTWMDAKVGDYVVTPRIGCPVEINALWYNAMCIYEHFCSGCDVKIHKQIKSTKETFLKNFEKSFMTKDGYLLDVVSEKSRDECFRPNQIYAVSLPFSILSKEKEKKIVKLVEKKLLTPYGLRTLDTQNPQFIGNYRGDQWERDTAYHQGTVWPFLLMEYWQAFLKVNNFSAAAKRKVLVSTMSLQSHFYHSDCIHGISEIFDGENPETGRGCVNQAWSVAAMVKLFAEHELFNLYKE
ncbi:amylo-alpha-1,6-glucosidase [Flagellimonas sp. CMM7]|uniref:amylo-alpha-1,6-glucosidase n=1 Tax=Flagellimonas sp. CMM7 TaxID=2654676 RepID=UPI0013CF7C31|nr:amylo-alpha-1,6-glucosidase [Flagellimonas sp. CMM7]UII80318.1 amylo-alpha-1,6-glucosidase [Flagellimonas sp. CMM7]